MKGFRAALEEGGPLIISRPPHALMPIDIELAYQALGGALTPSGTAADLSALPPSMPPLLRWAIALHGVVHVAPHWWCVDCHEPLRHVAVEVSYIMRHSPLKFLSYWYCPCRIGERDSEPSWACDCILPYNLDRV